MTRLLRHRLFATLVVMLLACGYAHQLEGTSARHHHCDADAGEGASHEEDSSGTSADGCEHAVCHHGVTAVFAPIDSRASYAPHLLGTIELVASLPPDAIPLGIDHPPQLA